MLEAIGIDWRTMIGTLLVAPIVYFTLRKLAAFFRRIAGYALEGLLWFVARLAFRRLAARLSMRQYCRIQLAAPTTSSLTVPGTRDITLSTDRVFVPLTLEHGVSQARQLTDSNMLSVSNRIRVVGDPGSGKSSLIKKLFRDACRDGLREPTKRRLPVMLELRSLNPPNEFADERTAGSWLLAELRETVGVVHGYDVRTFFDTYTQSLGLLVLLDGLDEVSSDRYPGVQMALRGLSQILAGQSDENVVVLTMRVQFHQQVGRELAQGYPQTLHIKPFSPNEIYNFLTKWPFEGSSDDPVANIYSDLTDRPTLREMCGNPLVLAMYVANHQSVMPGEIPDTRTEFYRQVVDELIVLRRRRQEIVSSRAGGLREQRESLLGGLALENLLDTEQPANSLEWSNAVARSARIWSCSPGEAEWRFRQLAQETGIIAEERPSETLRFIHLTFCEFLAAKECAVGRSDGWAKLIRRHSDLLAGPEVQSRSRLIEVIPFALALLPRLQRPQALSDVTALNDSEVLGRCLLEVQMYDHVAWSHYVQSERLHLAAERGASRQQWLRRLHLLNAVLRDARDWAQGVARRPLGLNIEEIFRELAGGDDESLVEVFSAYASHDAAAAFRLAESVGIDMLGRHPEVLIKSCQEAPFLAIALDRAKKGRPCSREWTQILAEAALRYESVSASLARQSLLGPDGEDRRSQAWTIRSERRASLSTAHGVLLSDAVSRFEPDSRSRFEALATIVTVKPPSKLLKAGLLLSLWCIPSVVVTVGLMALLLHEAGLGRGDLPNQAIPRLIGIAPFLYLPWTIGIFAQLGYVRHRRRVYLEMVLGIVDTREPKLLKSVNLSLGKLVGRRVLRRQHQALLKLRIIRSGQVSATPGAG